MSDIDIMIEQPGALSIDAFSGVMQTGGAVSSVNGQTGAVVLDAEDVGAAASDHTHAYSAITGTPTIPTDAHINGLIDSKIGSIETAMATLADRAEEVSA